ncbi:MAG: serine hydrolase domain-containing protein [Pseudomonadota bacterium]
MFIRICAVVIAAIVGFPHEAAAQAAPASITTKAIDKKRLARIDDVLQAEVDAGVRAGFAAAVIHKGSIVYETAVGFADIENQKPIDSETRFRIASMTKPITTVALMMLVEEGRALLSDPLSKYIPEFANVRVATNLQADRRGDIPTMQVETPITLHHLLTHTSGLGYIFDPNTDLGKILAERNLYLMEGDLNDRVTALSELPLYAQPGTTWIYSYATDVVGRVIEVISGKDLETFFQERIFEPLGMTDTEFFYDESDFRDLAVVYTFDEAGELVPHAQGGSLPSANTTAFGWYSGGGGLVSTVRDYAKFAAMLISGGRGNGKQLISPASVRLMTQNHLTESQLTENFRASGEGFGLGFSVVTDLGPASRSTALGEYGWGGYYDTSIRISPADKLGIIVMTQREPGPNERPTRAHMATQAIAYGALK